MELSQFSRTGTVLSTDKTIGSRELAKYAMDKLKVLHPEMNILFDMMHNDGGAYGVHEFCGALGGISIRYLNLSIHQTILMESIYGKPSNFVDYCELLRESMVSDKYVLRDTQYKAKQIVFLSGSNIMHENINFEAVDSAVAEGAIIKPHPVTHAKDIQWLKSRYGEDKVLGPKVSGATLLKQAEIVYMAKNSELWLLAIAHRKTVRYVGNAHFMAEVYRAPIDAIWGHPIYMPRVAMNRLFSASQSGIYFSKEEIDNGLHLYVKRVKELTK